MDPAFYELLCTHTGVAMIAADANLSVCLWNRSATRMLGRRAEEMVGHPIAEAVAEDQREQTERLFHRVLTEQRVTEFEFVQTNADGEPAHLAVTIAPVVDADGRSIGVSACIRDITRRIILQKRAARDQKMAALGVLAGSVAHHFNNLLGGIVTAVDYAMECGEPRATRRALEVTADSVNRASKLIDRLLAFAEGDRRAHDAPDLTDLTETVLQFVEQTEDTLRARRVKLRLTLNPIPVVEVPGIRLLTVLRSLVDNALEAMPSGGELDIRLDRQDKRVLLHIADSGEGMDEEDIEHAFEPFFSTKNAQPGIQEQHLGLGLAAAHGIVKELGGEISVNSRPGRGCGFDILLPISDPRGRP